VPARRLIAAALAGAILAFAGCGGDDDGGGDQLDTADIQERLTAKLEEPTGTPSARREPIEVTSLECPGEVEKKKGAEFECDVETSDGLSGTVEVELDDDEGEAVTYEAQLEGENRTVGKSGSLDPGEP
jgi:hypothetical protein